MKFALPQPPPSVVTIHMHRAENGWSSKEVSISTNSSIGNLKRVLVDCATTNVRLVIDDRVLNDEEATLSSVGIGAGARVWVIDAVTARDFKADGENLSLLLHSIFPLEDEPPSDAQFSPSEYTSLVSRFISSLSDASSPWQPGASDVGALRAALEGTFWPPSDSASSDASVFSGAPSPIVRGCFRVQWFSAYGCSVVAKQCRVGCLNLIVVGLDGWHFNVHASSHDGSAAANHVHGGFVGRDSAVILQAGTIDVDDYGDFCGHLMWLLSKARARNGTKRSAAANSQGHQRTPSMIEALVTDALRCLKEEEGRDLFPEGGTTPPRGGFTDVGLHTGGRERNTSWPLVRTVLQVLLEDSSEGQTGHELYRSAISHFYLWLTEACLAKQMVSEVTRGGINSLMVMLETSVHEACALIHDQIALPAFEQRCVLVRWELDQLSVDAAKAAAKKFELLPLNSQETRRIQLDLPELSTPGGRRDTMEERVKRMEANIEWLHTPFPSNNKSWRLVSEWLGKVSARAEDIGGSYNPASFLVLSTVESFVFSQVELLSERSKCAISVRHVENVVDSYRTTAAAFRRSPSAAALLTAERRSLEMLVIWTAFCLIHKTVSTRSTRKESLLRNYAVALEPESLSYLVLSGKDGRDAACTVSAYLRSASNYPEKIFSLQPGDKTFELAEYYAREDEVMAGMLKEEQRLASVRCNQRWSVVTSKLKQLQILDSELALLNGLLADAKYRIRSYSEPRSGYNATSYVNDKKYNQILSEIRSIQTKVNVKQAEIQSTEQPPPEIFQPLPKDECAARRIIFGIMLPPDIDILMRMSFSAQQQLVPMSPSAKSRIMQEKSTKIDVAKLIRVKMPPTSWKDYYNNDSTTRSGRAVTTKVDIRSTAEVPKGRVGPSNVRKYSAKSDGIWHPDSLVPSLCWNGGGFALDQRGGYFDPFISINADAVTHEFTERLDDARLQWALPLYKEQSRTRGNVAESMLDVKPGWLDESAYLEFGAIRAFPNQQIRKLIAAFHSRSFPLGQAAVQMLVQQALFHLGELSTETMPRPLWRTDLEIDGWDVLKDVLDSLADELKFKTRDHRAILLLGSVAAHASQWHDDIHTLRRNFASIAHSWAETIKDELETAKPSEVAGLRARRCIFLMYAMVSHGAGPFDASDASDLIKLAVSADYCRLFEDPTDLDDDIQALEVVTQCVMSRRLPELLQLSNDDFLTEAVRLVIQSTPSFLKWEALLVGGEVRASCFFAVDQDNLYSINVQTGVVLLNGLPPRRLPTTYTKLPLYRRTFGDRNFEVVATATGVLRTLRPISGRFYYEFFLDASTRKLIVREVDDHVSSASSTLELLDGTLSGSAAWGDDLPIRLQRMHSHWFSRGTGLVVLRDTLFSERRTHFLLQKQGPTDDGFECREVTDHFKKYLSSRFTSDLASEVKMFNRLVIIDYEESNILRNLVKFEDNMYIHTLLDNKDTLLVDLPRYDLSFMLRDGLLWSNNFQGFRLSMNQQFHDALHTFTNYLVFEQSKIGARKIAMPEGDIRADSSHVWIVGNSDCDAERNLYVYEEHQRFKTLEAPPGGINARLQLATLYAATGTKLAEARSSRTGGEEAVELLRQSWSNKPLTPIGFRSLRNLSQFSDVTPAVPILCHELDASSRELAFLHPGEVTSEPLPLDLDAATGYRIRKQASRLNKAATLTRDEELYTMGYSISRRPHGHCSVFERFLNPVFPTFNVDEPISKTEQYFRQCLREKKLVGKPFPAEYKVIGTELAKAMTEENEQSWDAHQSSKIQELSKSTECISMEITEYLEWISNLRFRLENQILTTISDVPSLVPTSKGRRNVESVFRLRRTINMSSRASLRDLARAAISPEEILIFNPFLSENSVEILHRAVIGWLKLCSFEDKVNRVVRLALSGLDQELLLELQEVERQWSVTRFPHWLVFEVEQQLQIRRVQYVVADFMINNPLSIVQLNMGMGKTRVILPMIVHELAQPGRLIRLNFLSQLLSEGYDYLHRHLTASLVRRRLYLLPFHRDVKLTPRKVSAIIKCLQRCESQCGALCVAPEHRLSLNLKWHELNLGSAPSESVLGVLQALPNVAKLPFHDVLDESDEILRHKYQLIYAVGHCQSLPAGAHRWTAVHAVLNELHLNLELKRLLSISDIAKRISVHGQRGSGAFDDIRLLPGPKLDSKRDELTRALAMGVIDNPPYSMRWLSDTTVIIRETIVAFVTDPAKSLDWLDVQPGGASITRFPRREQLLALRSLLACGLLEHCLTRRHRVDYGVDKRRGSRRRVAVPFRASDTPAERAEYAQPDTLIVMTFLSYFHDGLSESDVKEAVTMLFRLGPSAQEEEYKLWVASSRDSMDDTVFAALDVVAKLDLTSELQLSLLWSTFRYNMHMIAFWLAKCVLPRETIQYPSRLVTNACHLTDTHTRNVIGFSGTKDSHRLLPVRVAQEIPPAGITLAATDGKMLELVEKQTKEVLCLPHMASGSKVTLSDFVLRESIAQKCSALIDAGALMAGKSNVEVAEKVIELLPSHSPLLGAVYFDAATNSWSVLDKRGRTWPLGSSPIRERDAFVFFDESRCRGADMKLKANAIAALTIGPEMCKDKLMQAAGRMRQLQFSQKLLLIAPPELVVKIAAESKKAFPAALETKTLLRWIIVNTVRSTADGLAEWGKQSLQFCYTEDPSLRLLDETFDLEALYGSSISKATVHDEVVKANHFYAKRCEGLDTPSVSSKELVCETLRRAKDVGSDIFRIATGVDEECERELECEREVEREIERQLPRQLPVSESMWNLSSLFNARSPTQVERDAGVKPLSTVIKERIPTSIKHIKWESTPVFVTENFIETVLTTEGKKLGNIGSYLRPTDAIILFSSPLSALLLSEFEADMLLKQLWSRLASDQPPQHWQLVNFCYLCSAMDSASRSDFSPAITLSLPRHLQGSTYSQPATARGIRAARRANDQGAFDIELLVAGIQLFSGDTKYPSDKRKAALHKLLPTRESKRAALLPASEMRGKGHMVSRSDLEEVCAVDIGEE